MGVSGPKDLMAALGIQAQVDRIYRDVAVVAEDVGLAAEQLGRHVIETSPTLGDWSGFYQYKSRWKEDVRARTGRVDSGQMLRDYVYRVKKEGEGKYVIEVGWVDGDKGYYADQEYGFLWTSPDGSHSSAVPGMHAQERSKPDVKKFTDYALKDIGAKRI